MYKAKSDVESNPDLYITASKILIWCTERVAKNKVFKSDLNS